MSSSLFWLKGMQGEGVTFLNKKESKGSVSLLLVPGVRLDYRSGMYTFLVPCLFFLTDLLLWLGRDSTWLRSNSQRNEKDNRKAELMGLMTTPKRTNKE